MARIPVRDDVRVSAMGVRVVVVESVVRYADIMPTKSGSISGTVVHGVLGKIVVLSELYRSISVDVV